MRPQQPAPRRRQPIRVERRRRSLPYWPGWLAVFFVAVVGLGTVAAILVLRSDYLRVHQVEVTGGEHTDPAAVRRAVNLEGLRMWDVDEAAVAAIVTEDPTIRDVTLTREWPDTIALTIHERQPWGYWQVEDRLYVVDTDGIVLEDFAAPVDAPLIVQIEGTPHLKNGDRVDTGALRAVNTFSAFDLGRVEMAPSSFEWSEDEGLAIVTETGVRAVIGDAQDIESKLQVWAATVDQAAASGIKVREIDLRFGRSPAIRS